MAGFLAGPVGPMVLISKSSPPSTSIVTISSCVSLLVAAKNTLCPEGMFEITKSESTTAAILEPMESSAQSNVSPGGQSTLKKLGLILG